MYVQLAVNRYKKNLCTFAANYNTQQMGRKFLFLTLLILFIFKINIHGQERIVFKGKIIDFITYQSLENACIHNLSSGLMVFSNNTGDFSLMISPNDTLAISRVGYEMEIFIAKDSLIDIKGRTLIKLAMKAIMLRNVTVYAMKPYPLFIKDLTKNTPQQKMDIPGTELSPLEKASYDIHNGNLLRGTHLASPISFLYEKFSHKGKMNRLYVNMLANQQEVMRVSQKYNPEIVNRITKLEGEQLDDFMLYCSFSYYTLVTSTDIEIEQMIANKFVQYKRENKF